MHTETNTDDANVEEDKDLKADNGDADRRTRRERIKVIKSNLFNTLENIIVDYNSGASRSAFLKIKSLTQPVQIVTISGYSKIFIIP